MSLFDSSIFKNRSLREKIILFLSFGFGTGLFKKAPGTWGTIPGVILAYFTVQNPTIHFSITLFLIIVGTWLCSQSSKILKTHDHSGIVIDEIAGVMLSLSFFSPTAFNLILGFLLFRFFDILKPWPIITIDKKVSGGLGIMLDDLIAGIFSWISLYLIHLIFQITP